MASSRLISGRDWHTIMRRANKHLSSFNSKLSCWHRSSFSLAERTMFLLSRTSLYSTVKKITKFWLVENSTINPKLYSVGVPIKFPWKRRILAECTINKKSQDLLVQFVNNRYSWFWKFSNFELSKSLVPINPELCSRSCDFLYKYMLNCNCNE